MDDKELEKELKANVNEILEEEKLKIEDIVMDIKNEFDNIAFEEIENYLEKEQTLIASYKSYNEAIKDGVTDEEILARYERDNEIEVQRIELLLKKVTNLIEEKAEPFENAITNFEITNNTIEEIELYNKNVTALSDFYDKTGASYKEYDTINIEEVKKDINEYNTYCTNLDNTSYEKIGESIDAINKLVDKYPNSQKLFKSSSKIIDVGTKLLDDKEKELLNMQKSINITRNEAKIFDSSKDDNDFVTKMMEQDKEVISQKESLNIIEQECASLNEKLATLDPKSNEYKDTQKELEDKNNEYSDISNKISTKENEYLNRKLELNEFDKEHGKKIEEFNNLKEKLGSLRDKYLSLAKNYDKRNKNVKESQEQEVVENQTQENNNKNEQENNKKESKGKNSNSKNNSIVTGNNTQSQESNNSKNQKDLDTVLTPANAKNIVDNFLKMNDEEQRKFLQDNGYYKLNEAIDAIKGNKDGIKLSKKERNKINDIIDSEIKNSLKEEEVKLKDGDIVSLMNKLTKDYPNINNDELYKKLFLYNEDGIPFIANDMILSEDKSSLAFMVTEYMKNLRDGNLKELEIEDFEKYILNPLNASIIKENLDNMNLSTRIRNKFSKAGPSYRLVNSALRDLREVKGQIKSGKNLTGSIDNYVYTPDELVSVIEEIETDRLSRNSKTEPSKDEEPSL